MSNPKDILQKIIQKALIYEANILRHTKNLELCIELYNDSTNIYNQNAIVELRHHITISQNLLARQHEHFIETKNILLSKGFDVSAINFINIKNI
jgi:hypothetical protein